MLFVVDFDGTVVPKDTIDELLEQFAHPEWKRLEEEWVRGEIDSRQCMAAQIALVRGDEHTLARFFQSLETDPEFDAFVAYASSFSDLVIASDGLDYPIACTLRRLGSNIPFSANRLTFRPDGIEISFPHSDAACAVRSAVCKCAVARRSNAGRGLPVVLIGDGRSDLCTARFADYVFAKGTLRRCCEAESITHSPFETFADVLAVVRGWAARGFGQFFHRSVHVR